MKCADQNVVSGFISVAASQGPGVSRVGGPRVLSRLFIFNPMRGVASPLPGGRAPLGLKGGDT